MNYNILLDNLPQITPNGFKIRTDFRESIKFELLMQDTKIIEKEKIYLALNLYYKEIPHNIEKALHDLIWFYSGNNIKKDISKNIDNKKTTKEIYSYEFDSKYIFSAFLEQYKIDLNNIKYMHWWKFKALFEGLGDNTKIVQIMGYRSIDLSKIKDKEEKARYKKLKTIYALPDMRTTQQKEADFGSAFW